MENISVSNKLLPPSAKRAKRVSTLDYNNWLVSIRPNKKNESLTSEKGVVRRTISTFGHPTCCEYGYRIYVSSLQPWPLGNYCNLLTEPTHHSEYNPPQFLIDAYRKVLDQVEGNQYGPTSGMPTFKKALADTYSPLLGRTIDPESEILVTTGASEGLLSIVMGYVEPGEEVILLEPVFSAACTRHSSLCIFASTGGFGVQNIVR
ncbi:kynurenine aminotransferase protein [Rutstroemia sp. NJR-2017a BBW]|nr:kynurenine aminotransferase protein [Rutstroemia sp. NJR-2017a BBW]